MNQPRVPRVMLFLPGVDRSDVLGERYVADLAQTEVRAQVRDTTTETNVADRTITNPTTNVHLAPSHITGGALIEGRVYQARIRYRNSDGWSGWSAWINARVPYVTTPWEPLAVPDEPELGGVLPLVPDSTLVRTQTREIDSWRTETRHLIRRPRRLLDRESVRLQWSGLSKGDFTTVHDFLLARADAVQSWTAPTVEFGELELFTRRGQIQWRVANKAYDLTVDADEIVRDRVFTVARSKIGGPDPIKRG